MRTLICALLLVLLNLNFVYGWGFKGHRIQARLAIELLPTSMPSFLRDASLPMSMMISEPDYWRNAEQPSLDEVTGVNHTFRWEIAPKPLPPNRHFFIIELAKQGKLSAKKNSVRQFGTSPYGIQEWAEMLTGAFRRWRNMKEDTPDEKALKKAQEHNILFIAAVLGHWVTDASNPIHSSVHVHGWHEDFPNPNGYATKADDPHSRYEAKYVENVIEYEDVAKWCDRPVRRVQDWLTEAARYIGNASSHVEQIYRWDKEARFGEGNEPIEAKAFTAQRLAEGALELRDIWYTAWVRSGEPMPKRK